MPAGGFGIDVESVAESLAGASRPEVATRRDTVRIALTKGRLEKKTLALLKAAGYDISELEAGTRKLIFTLPDSGVEIVLSKAADVITYVEHGVCDMGVVGKDTIMEKGRQLLRNGRSRLSAMPLRPRYQEGQGRVRRL